MTGLGTAGRRRAAIGSARRTRKTQSECLSFCRLRLGISRNLKASWASRLAARLQRVDMGRIELRFERRREGRPGAVHITKYVHEIAEVER